MKSMPRCDHGLWGMGSGCNLQMARGLGHGTCCTADDEPSDCKCHAWPPVTFLQEQEGLIDPGVTSAPRGVCGIHYLSTENGWEVNLTSWGAWQSRIFSVGLGDLSMPTGSGKRWGVVVECSEIAWRRGPTCLVGGLIFVPHIGIPDIFGQWGR